MGQCIEACWTRLLSFMSVLSFFVHLLLHLQRTAACWFYIPSVAGEKTLRLLAFGILPAHVAATT